MGETLGVPAALCAPAGGGALVAAAKPVFTVAGRLRLGAGGGGMVLSAIAVAAVRPFLERSADGPMKKVARMQPRTRRIVPFGRCAAIV